MEKARDKAKNYTLELLRNFNRIFLGVGGQMIGKKYNPTDIINYKLIMWALIKYGLTNVSWALNR